MNKACLQIILEDAKTHYVHSIVDAEQEIMRHEAMGRRKEYLAAWRTLRYLLERLEWTEKALKDMKKGNLKNLLLLVIASSTLVLGACTEQGAPTQAPQAGPTMTCTIAEEAATVKWNGAEKLTIVAVCSDSCLHFTENIPGSWTQDTATNCSASSWPSLTWNGDAYQDAKPAAPPKVCSGWTCK